MIDDRTPISLGLIIGAFGLRGEVVVRVTGDSPEGLGRYESLFWRPESGVSFAAGDASEEPGGEVPEGASRLDLEWVRAHKGKALVRFRGITHRHAAERLVGGELWLPRGALKPAGPDRFYIADLIGLMVETTTGEPVGPIRDVLENPANDIFVVDAGGREVLIPHVHTIVKTVDPDAGRVVIDPIPGLLDG